MLIQAHKKILLIALLCWPYLKTVAQVIDANICTPDNRTVITRHVAFFKSLQNIPIDSVIKPTHSKLFSPLPDKVVIFSGYDPYYYWFRFIIRNTDSVPKNLMLLMGPIGMREANLYQRKQGNWHLAAKTGTIYPFLGKAYLYAHDVLPLAIPGHTTDTLYLQIDETGNFKTFAFALLHPLSLKKIENQVYFSFGIITGMLLLFALFNLYLFVSIKEKVHLWYSLYLFILIFLLIKNEGLDAQFLHLDSENGYRLTPIMGIGAITIGLLIHVTQLFFSNIHKASILYRLTRLVKILVFLFAVIHFIVFYISPGYKTEQLFFELADKTTVTGVILILINSIYSIIKGFKPAIFILIGMIIFLIGSIERLLVISTPTYLFPPSLFQIGMVIETTIISFALMYRYNRLKQEKDHLALELEKSSKEASNQIILTLEAEQKRIARDLHDDLGSNLAAIKMGLEELRSNDEKPAHLIDMVDNASTSIRNIAHNLMPADFENTSLTELLDKFYLRLNTENKISFQFYSTGTNHRFNKQEDLMIYRVILELTNNIIKHSGATKATIQLIYYDQHLEIMIEDNGTGMHNQSTEGIGLNNVRSRVDYLRGRINTDSGPIGTTITIHIPYTPVQ